MELCCLIWITPSSNSAASERAAFAAAMTVEGIADPQPYFAVYSAINSELWAAVERQEIQPDDVRVTRFERLTGHFGLAADPIEMADTFVAGLGTHGELYDGAGETLQALAAGASLALVTNGIGQVQRARIARLGLDAYFPVIAISGELGCSKPGSDIFKWVFGQLGWPDKNSTLIVGDSLASDIQGGADFGIGTCWFNPAGRRQPAGMRVDHVIRHLSDVLPLATGTCAQ